MDAISQARAEQFATEFANQHHTAEDQDAAGANAECGAGRASALRGDPSCLASIGTGKSGRLG